MNIVTAVSATFLLLGSALADSDAVSQQSFPSAGLKQVIVTNGAGDVRVSGGAGSEAELRTIKHKGSEKCQVVARLDGETLRIKVEKTKRWQWWGSCEIEIQLKVPTAVDAEVTTGSGDIRIVDLTGAIDFRVGSGDVHLCGTPSRASGRSGSGDIFFNGSTANAKFKVGSGDVELTMQALPSQGRIELVSGSGDGVIWLPKGAIFTVAFSAGSGELASELQPTSTAGFAIRARSGSGDLTLREGH